jgi:CBS domain containing-hemolysin-like protein
VSVPVALAAGVALLIANGFFVAAEFALLASRRSRIEQLAAAGDRRARHAIAGIRELSLMLAGAQLGITICSLLLGAVAEPALAGVFETALGNVVTLPAGVRHGIAFTVALSIVVFLHMVVGEMAPKSWAISHPESSALSLAGPFRAFALLFRPAIKTLNLMANAVVRLVGVEPQAELAMVHSPADLRLLIEESAGYGAIAQDEQRLLTRSLELSGLDAAAAMTPRLEIVSVDADEAATAIAEVARTTGRSRVVVRRGDLDHIVGVVHAKDVLLLDPSLRATTTARDLARPVPATHEGHLLEDLLVEMRTSRQHLAVVVDEHGVVAGIVTLEDVLEELIGDFEDESDRQGRRCRRLADGTFRLVGGLRPDELAVRTGVALPPGEWETVAGFVIATLDRIPVPGDQVRVPGALLVVSRVDGYAIVELRLWPSGPDGADTGPDPEADPGDGDAAVDTSEPLPSGHDMPVEHVTDADERGSPPAGRGSA